MRDIHVPLPRFVRRWLILLPVCACVTACALIHHDRPPAAFIAPEQIRLADDIHLASEGWPSARWWDQYRDPQLDALIDRALGHAPTLAIAREHVSQAHAQVELIRAGSGLQASTLAEADREHVSGHGFLSAYSSHDPAIGAYGPWYWTGLVGVDAHYDVDLWGKQRDLVRAALGEQNARRAEAAQAELEVSTGVAQLYYQIQIVYVSLGLLQQLRSVDALELDARTARHERGLEALTQSAEARAQLLALDQQIASAQEQIVQTREALRALVGAGPDDLPELTPVALPSPSVGLPATLSFELLNRRPDLQALRWLAAASFDRVDAAKAAFYPSFDITAFFGFNALRMRDLFTRSGEQINFIPGLTLPIFDGGRLNAGLHGARAASNTLIEQYNEAVLGAVRDIAQTGSEIDDLDHRAQLQRERIEAIRVTSDSTEAQYQRGLADRAAAMKARAPVIEGQLALLQLNGDELEAEIVLTRALGGGYRSDDLPPLARSGEH
ncbi:MULTISPECIES: MdtP family multidrug efflux transporter outer membrane subunit [Paraburkholderia]|uniref:MdtP family multidrug efflux transporter outer membrane subunit n=1 Tax=Paraburkholderia TaxID=1822464 RepID=UPI0022584CFC|nr:MULTISPECIES: MdtP family multidrug efflux transporter outer membrane subunit [Paraburkholderia]MCX4161289.1 MdtP family multidrug efflux transporter outer membrane subunit [Paraburkholderia megapolitana]MDN7156785.1 MdtP family multidrug efflux transporter outer membrane subunit [Paraburkholderia sp. CHISQ3]MDQ6493830.1 MdtP family multidrug efflux transporter outer membrane subunit [Paraburkholderia megapolitana]